MPNDLVRLKEVRAADVRNDQKSAAEIQNANVASQTQEDFQQFVLSQLKRIIFGDAAGTWNADFAAAGITNLRDVQSGGGSGPTLLSYIDEGPVEGFTGGYKEIVGSPWPTSVVWYTDDTKTKKIVEKVITRDAEQAPTGIVWRLYELDGVTVHIEASDAITNTTVFETSRTRVIS